MVGFAVASPDDEVLEVVVGVQSGVLKESGLLLFDFLNFLDVFLLEERQREVRPGGLEDAFVEEVFVFALQDDRGESGIHDDIDFRPFDVVDVRSGEKGVEDGFVVELFLRFFEDHRPEGDDFRNGFSHKKYRGQLKHINMWIKALTKHVD